MLEQLNNTHPNIFFSLVARFPLGTFLLCLTAILAASVPAILHPPRMNNDFRALLIKDHPAALRNVAVGISLAQYAERPWDAADAEASPGRRARSLLQAQIHERDLPRSAAVPRVGGESGGGGEAARGWEAGRWDAAQRPLLPHKQVVAAPDGPLSGFPSDADVQAQAGVRQDWDERVAWRARWRRPRGLLQTPGESTAGQCWLEKDEAAAVPGVNVSEWQGGATERCPCVRPEAGEGRLVHVFYRQADGSNVLTPAMLEKVIEVERGIMALDSYDKLCLRQADGSCQAPLGFPAALYAEVDNSTAVNDLRQPESVVYRIGEEARDIQETAEKLLERNVSMFFDVNANSTHADHLHTFIWFCLGAVRDGEAVFRAEVVPELTKLLDEQAGVQNIIINYGEATMNEHQVNQTIMYDSLWAVLSLALAAITLRIGCGSTFLTTVGIFQVLASFPISWTVYSVPTHWEYLTFLHLLAPFVIFGIGLDDIFVFVTYFFRTQKYCSLFALDTRLTATFNAAATATLATSTTSAFAFLANILSPVPAIQSFGLVLATLVLVNYALAITWIPIALALWDARMVLPKRRRMASDGPRAGASDAGGWLAGWLPAASVASGALKQQSLQEGRTRKHVAQAQAEDFKELEYGKLVFRQRPPEGHRLAQAPEVREFLELRDQETAEEERTWITRVREDMFDWVFGLVWNRRLLCMALCLLLSAAGAVGTLRLRPPSSSEPPLFDADHNVQFFYRYMNSAEAENFPACSTCNGSLADALSLADLLAVLGADSGPGARGPAALGAGKGVQLDARTEARSRVRMVLAWGLDSDGGPGQWDPAEDPSAPPTPADLVFDPSFDLADPQTQHLILSQIQDTLQGAPQALEVTVNPLGRLQRWCAVQAQQGGAKAAGCDALNGTTGLPTGAAFNSAVLQYLTDHPDTRKFLGYSLEDPLALNDNSTAPPAVSWMRAHVTTATRKAEPPTDIAASYEAWNAWAEDLQQGLNYTGMLAASEDWVTAVTYTEIAGSVLPTVFLSIVITGAVVFVFTGRLALTLFSTLTVLMINVTVMGCTWLMGWSLGAVEGMSITSLVGLSVDFCIHLTEAHMHAHGDNRYAKARSALAVVGIPMVSAGLSTIMTTLPLFGTYTLVLRRFAAVIALTMAIGLGYVVLFLSPAIAIFGPDEHHIQVPKEWGGVRRVLVLAYSNNGVRFVAICGAMLTVAALAPKTSERLRNPGTFRSMYDAIMVVMGIAAVITAVRLAIQVYKLYDRRKRWGLDSHAMPMSFNIRDRGKANRNSF